MALGKNVETLRSFYEGLNTSGEAPTEPFHRDVEIHMFEGAPISGPYLGLDGLHRWCEDSFDILEDGRLLLDDVIAGDDPDVMVVTNRFVGRARHTQLTADFPLTVVVRFRDGLIVRFEGYRERAEALAAAGMASANLDLVRSIYASVGRGDYSSADWADPEIEFVVADGPEPGRATGLAGLAEVMRTILSVSEDLHTEVEEYRELDAERVLVLTRWNSRGKKSGVPVVGAGAEVFMIRDGKVIGITVYYDRGRAFADLGLTPEAD